MSSGKSKQQLAALRKVKADIESIAAESTNIAVYQFDTVNTKWDRLGVEGGAFIAQAATAPIWSLIVLNRAGPDNFVLDISSLIKVKLQPPYLMLRCTTSGAPCIYGLWFHDTNERLAFVEEMDRCITLAKPLKPAVKVKPAIVEQEQKPRVENYASPGKSPDCDIDIIPLSKLEGHINSQTSLLPKKTVKAAGASNSSKGLSIADVSAGLISPSDITGFMRQFPKRD